MKSVLIVLMALFCSFCFGQTVIQFEAIEQSTKLPVSQLSISSVVNGIESKSIFTNSKGIAHVTVPSNDSVSFVFDHVAYEVTNDSGKKIYTGDTVNIRLKMVWTKVRTLEEVVLPTIGKPDTIFQSDRLSVHDFEFLPDGKMVLLAYPKTARKGTDLLLVEYGKIIDQVPMKDNALELIRDYRGNPHVVTDKTVSGVFQRENEVRLRPINKDYFMTYIAPIVDTNVSRYFFSNFSEVYPAFDYFTYNFVDSSYRKIANIEDDFMMELYRSEYKWVDVRTKIWAKEKEFETGIDAEVWVGATYFTQSIYYKELYAPMFRRNDSIFLFDHYKNWMYRFTNTGDLIDSLPIYYHLKAKENGWQKKLIQDQTTGQIYIVYELAGKTTLQRFDCATGKLGEMIPLYFKYADNIIIRDNFVYYIYRPFESIQKKFLYNERLPIFYPLAETNNGD